MAQFVPETFWSDLVVRKLRPPVQLVYLWVCCRVESSGTLYPWDPAACAMEVFGAGYDPSKADKMIRTCDRAGAVLLFDPLPPDNVFGKAVSVARWATVAPHLASLPADGDPYPSASDIESWEKSRKSPFRIVKPNASKEAEPSDQEMDLANEIWVHWVTSRAAARPNATPAILDKSRIMGIVRFLRNHVTVSAMKMAIDGCFSSPWHMGGNPRGRVFDQIELIFKDAAHFERFVELGRISKGNRDEDYISSVMREMRERKKRVSSKTSATPSLEDFEDLGE